MPEPIWTAVDDYITAQAVRPDAALEQARTATAAAGLPDIAVSAPQGKLLGLLATMVGARRILEIGVLGGYSTIWLARALPPIGRLITLEVEPRHAEVARANVVAAGVGDRVEVRVGAALETLPRLVEEGAGPFDFVFIDADKANIPEYFDWSLRLARPGTAIVVDNVVRNGALVDEASTDGNVTGVRRFHDLLAREPRVEATTIQTVGAKGYDGFTLALVAERSPRGGG